MTTIEQSQALHLHTASPQHVTNLVNLSLLTDDDLMRFSRQILLNGWDEQAQLKLKQAKVAIVGMGGLGCPAAQVLARAGVGYMRLIDADTIEISNLQRQFLYKKQHIGRPKAVVAAQQLQDDIEWQQFESIVSHVDADNVISLLQGFNLILDCSDNFATRDLMNQASQQLNIPLLSAAAVGYEGQLTLFEPNQTACYNCLFGSYDANDTHDDARRCVNTGVLSSNTAIVGANQANMALLYLGLGQNPLANKLMLFNALTGQSKTMQYQIDVQCKVCQTNQ